MSQSRFLGATGDALVASAAVVGDDAQINMAETWLQFLIVQRNQ